MEAVHHALIDIVGGLHPLLQFLAVLAIGLVPYLESHVGAFVGTAAGVPIVLATSAAIIGNLVALVIAVVAGGAVARGIAARRAAADGGSTSGRRTQKVLAKVDRFGVPVASLLGPFVLATALSTFIMISAGLNRRTVVTWQTIAVIAWGVAFAVLGLGAFAAFG